mmetsp:Transcript_9926/g.18303  ORF Transcript_9926/g.18303 Transcript_9926/m.18303 type:complete len:160 (+) Transcript_9926:79-558(+)
MGEPMSAWQRRERPGPPKSARKHSVARTSSASSSSSAASTFGGDLLRTISNSLRSRPKFKPGCAVVFCSKGSTTTGMIEDGSAGTVVKRERRGSKGYLYVVLFGEDHDPVTIEQVVPEENLKKLSSGKKSAKLRERIKHQRNNTTLETTRLPRATECML